jgi:hypothetical protein
MISFNNIGNLGRLANQMFQYAALKGIARKHDYEFCIPPKEVFGVFDKNVKRDTICIYDVFNLEEINKVEITGNRVVRETGFHFNEQLFDGCEDNVDLLGYFQSEKYFKHIEDEIRKDFTIKTDILEDCKSFYNEHFVDCEVISLHVRRGDYLVNPNHPVQDVEYYKNALSHFDENMPVLVFSDDHEWCNEQELFSDDRFFISQGSDPVADLCIMTLCDYHIIANSSYSWWGAWLANGKKTIAPKSWFSGDCAKHDTKDLYCQNWSII